MENIKFENEALNNHFRKLIGKEEFSIEDINALKSYERNISARDVGQTLTQHDLDILCSATSMNFNGIDFKNLVFKDAKMEEIGLFYCNLEEATFENADIETVRIVYSRLKNNSIEIISGIKQIQLLELRGRNIYNRDKILGEFPNFNDLPIEERQRILSDPANILKVEYDLSNLSALEKLKSLYIENMKLTQNSLETIGNIDELLTLSITNSEIDEEIERSTLAESKIDYLYFRNIEGVDNILNCITEIRGIERLALNECGLSDITFLTSLPNLKELNLRDNNIDIDSIDFLMNLMQSDIKLDFNNTKAQEFLSGQKYIIEDKDLEKRIKKALGIDSFKEINLYELLKSDPHESITIQGKDVLEKLISTGLIEFIKAKNINIDIENFEGIELESILRLKEKLGNIKISNFRGLNQEIIENLDGIHWKIESDLLTGTNYRGEDLYYTKEDMSEILQIMDEIKMSIPENASELEKFSIVYKTLAMQASYDRTGNLGSDEYVKGMECLTRSLKGVLKYGKAVCKGYALALYNCLEYSADIRAEQISGYALGNPANRPCLESSENRWRMV